MQATSDPSLKKRFFLIALVLAGLASLVTAFLVFDALSRDRDDRNLIAAGEPSNSPVPEELDGSLTELLEANKILPLTAEEAREANEDIPFSQEPVEPARSVRLDQYAFTDAEIDRAVECLTSAIYYEAGFQPDQGKRAVAQVILNRVRHPAYPASVCDVIYEGSQRKTGCQFTFTCDGSLFRPPQSAAWQAARTVAIKAVTGTVEPSVGMATHYHADYVLPYWAKSLTKIDQVGQHIFYRWRGNWGKRASFSIRPMPDRLEVETAEAMPADASDFSLIDEVVGLNGNAYRIPVDENPIRADGMGQPTAEGNQLRSDEENVRLRADERAGTLILDETD